MVVDEDVLRYHVASTALDLTTAPPASTPSLLDGLPLFPATLPMTATNPCVMSNTSAYVNEAAVSLPCLPAINGLVCPLDRLLTPPRQTLLQVWGSAQGPTSSLQPPW